MDQHLDPDTDQDGILAVGHAVGLISPWPLCYRQEGQSTEKLYQCRRGSYQDEVDITASDWFNDSSFSIYIYIYIYIYI